MDIARQLNSSLHTYLQLLHQRFSKLHDGNVASYIPELSVANPNDFGIAIVTVDGQVFQVGDTYENFTIQSISKAITYGLALSEHGLEHVSKYVGVEPSGDAFNSISLDPQSGQPRNPMINAGAIATTAMIREKDNISPIERIIKTMENYVGHTVSINDHVYNSESKTGHRNRAISHLLRNFDIVGDDHLHALETYFQQCSINVNCRDLALLASCLANNGVNPITGVIALDDQYVSKVLSVMGSCGMYDYSGNWLYHVGMPAKSGVGGGIIAVLPGQFGLAIYSPPLDELGNSVRGIKVCETISKDFGLHLFHTARSTSSSVIRVNFDAINVRSRKLRPEPEHQYLKENGHRIRCYELQGELMFGSTVSMINQLMDETINTSFIIIDFHRVVAIDSAASRLWLDCLSTLNEMNIIIFFTGTDAHYKFVRLLVKKLPTPLTATLFQFSDRDHALEECENILIDEGLKPQSLPQEVDFADQKMCAGFSVSQLNRLQDVTKIQHYNEGEIIFMRGDYADSMYFIKSGVVEVFLKIDSTREKRQTTLSAGMSFGEYAMVNQNKRAASIRAVQSTTCYVLKFKDIDEQSRVLLFSNLAIQLASRMESETQEIEVLY